MTTNWQRAQPEVSPAGDCGGDHQVSDAFDARWSKPLPDGRFAVVTRAFYVAEDNGQQYMECQTEYVVCTDPTRPGETEWASDSSYDDVGVGNYISADVRRAALNADEPTDVEWNRIMPGWTVPS